jgi:hypothetical protein
MSMFKFQIGEYVVRLIDVVEMRYTVSRDGHRIGEGTLDNGCSAVDKETQTKIEKWLRNFE